MEQQLTLRMTHEENLFFAGMVAGHLQMGGILLCPKMENNLYTGEIDIAMGEGLHVLIRVSGFYQDKKEDSPND